MNESFKQAMMAALPSPNQVAAGLPQDETTSQAPSGSPIALGIEALSSKKQHGNQQEAAEKAKKHQGLRPLN